MKGIQAFISTTQFDDKLFAASESASSNSNIMIGGCFVNILQRKRRNIEQQRMMMMMQTLPESHQLDFETLPSLLNLPSTIILGSEVEAAQTFEPQVNTPALFSFVIIAFVFSLLQIRINSVRGASVQREEALTFLRQVKSEQLDSPLSSSSSSSSSSTTNNTPDGKNIFTVGESSNIAMDKKVINATKAYEKALKEELNLRTIIPGVRIVAPNDATRREEDIAAAKQFLGWDILIDENGDENEQKMENDESKKTSLLMQSRRRFDGKDIQDASSSSKNENEALSNGSKAVLLTVAFSQIVLLVLLSLDPMSSNNILADIVGNPPDNVPFSSWSN